MRQHLACCLYILRRAKLSLIRGTMSTEIARKKLQEALTPKPEGVIFTYFATAILHVIYFVLSFGQALNYLLYKIKHVILYLVSVEKIQDLKNLEKKPTHLALVVADLPVRFDDLAKILEWCHDAGIYYVTLYDFDGFIKNSPNELLEAAGPLARGKFKIQLHFFSHERHNEMASQNNVSGILNVHLAAAEDGRGALVEAAKKLHERGLKEVSISNVDQLLRVRTDWPEPDLLIRCGGLHSHLGFLPWALRLTEFVDFYSHKYLLPSEFRELLWKFANIERRGGK